MLALSGLSSDAISASQFVKVPSARFLCGINVPGGVIFDWLPQE
jgi:hypothetical protein